MNIHFVTSNRGKAGTLQSYFDFKGRKDIKIIRTDLDLVEIQADTVAEVSMNKARQAYEKIKSAVLVDDSGLAIEALNGFPGVYAKYVYSTIGAEGIVKLMAGETNRNAKFLGTATYIDKDGKAYQFHRKSGNVLIADYVSNVNSPLAWSVLWKIVWVEKYDKMLCEMSEREINQYYEKNKSDGTLAMFADWFMQKYR